ncbi:MAG: geranylgeranylglyceryl/heptaprenylglyceryl phosphate synthase, partial [Candidatus Paceibacterales bacterium]
MDPDKQSAQSLVRLVEVSHNCKADFFFIGGSLLLKDNFEATVVTLKSHSKIPVIIFPGNNYQVSSKADAILFLSLISGRNPEYLIGQQVVAAPKIKQAGIEVIPTGYI